MTWYLTSRSIDFAKVSKNIALVPHMESFSLPHSIAVALNVIRCDTCHQCMYLSVAMHGFCPTVTIIKIL